eukprot:gnl/MRDRNA2_/MRDRNA2_109985_c0_seq1.p1 gnl/MRDRNA2_/MRDRNA2_109985_c0~~gnl/MRDRNA2_/MRDRNA2_109985_c0_seq1.p1  ORF type:complete len:175 (-),score=38.22 gnl/MRDRNA2_/MRDRNA2_109985_c0_seq1:17-493(-)
MDAHGRQLLIEVLSVTDLGDSEYRVGDAFAHFFGTYKLHPFVEVSSANDEESMQSEAIEVEGDKEAKFNWKAIFDYRGQTSFNVKVHDKRDLQAVLRGHPLIGRGQVEIVPETELRDEKVRELKIRLAQANDGSFAKPRGWLYLRYQLLPEHRSRFHR